MFCEDGRRGGASCFPLHDHMKQIDAGMWVYVDVVWVWCMWCSVGMVWM